MFATQEITIAVPIEMVDELRSMNATPGQFYPRMVLTDGAISAAVIRALVIQQHDQADGIAKLYRDMKDHDSTEDTIGEIRELVHHTMFTLSALYLALTNAQVIINTEKDNG